MSQAKFCPLLSSFAIGNSGLVKTPLLPILNAIEKTQIIAKNS